MSITNSLSKLTKKTKNITSKAFKKTKNITSKVVKKTKNITKKLLSSKNKKKSTHKKHRSSHKKKTTRGGALTCPSGKIARVAYTKKSGTKVKEACVPNKGRPGKGGPIKITLDKKHLSNYGYDLKHSTTVRQKALLKAIRAKGARVILRRLVLLRTYRKNDMTKTGREQYARLDKDVKFIQAKHFSKRS